MKRKTVFLAISFVGIAAAWYHIREMERAYLLGFDDGWDGGKQYVRTRDEDGKPI